LPSVLDFILPASRDKNAQSRPFDRCAALTLCLSFFLLCAGCQWIIDADRPSIFSRPDAATKDSRKQDKKETVAASDPVADRNVLARSAERDKSGRNRSVWIHAVDQSPSPYRWRYPNLEELLSRPAESRPNLPEFLGDADAVVATNAAIGLARLGDGRGAQRLAVAAASPDLMLPMRCAAVEALASIPAATTVEQLRKLLDQYGRSAGNSSPYVPELHAELIRGLARHVDAADERRCVDALRSPSADVRLEALAAWMESQKGSLPVEVSDMRTNTDYRVRAAALRAMAKRRHPGAREYAISALQDTDIRVRSAAIAALGELGGSASQAALEGLLDKSHPERLRQDAVAALTEMGAKKQSLGAAADESWRVRLKVAEALTRWGDREGRTVASRLLDDPSIEVQRAVVASVSQWPLDQAGPLLLAAMDHNSLLIRKSAAARLVALWPAAAEFPAEGPAERRTASLAQLQSRFQQEFHFADQAALARAIDGPEKPAVNPGQVDQVERLIRERNFTALDQFGLELVEILEQLVFDRAIPLPDAVYLDILPRRGVEFDQLAKMSDPDAMRRRKASEQLAKLSAAKPLGRLASARLEQLVVLDQDPLVWQNALAASANNAGASSFRLACAAVGNASPEVRRRACDYLAAHGDPRNVKVLLPVLQDSSQSVVCAAVRALGYCGQLDDTGPLRRLSAAANEQVRLETAVALVRLHDPSGIPALERMTYSNDPVVRRQAALVMGEAADPLFTPMLIRLLDSEPGVSRAALESLPKTAGRDMAETDGRAPQTTAERIKLWKQWYQRQGSQS
jgi:HEAT repeat protein